jgi:DNA-binding CsgD family transcriptional regulator
VRPVAGTVAGRSAHLVGREPERARLQAFADALPGGARALLIRGEPGIGKTALLRAAVEGCGEAGCEVLLTRAAEEEMPLGLAGLVDLLEHAELDTAALLAEENPFARGRAVLEQLRRMAARGPVLIAVDDLQWLDHASARALRFALRRLDAEPVGVLATIRADADAHDPLAAASTLPPGRCETLHLGPLGLDELRHVLDGIIEAISRPMLQRIHQVSGGNPLYAIELARGLAAGGVPGRGRFLRLPESLQAAITSRLEALPRELVLLLETASALGPTHVAELREALPGVEALLASAEREGLLVVDDDLRVRFSHPLIGSVVYDRMSPLTRRSLHASLAARAADADVRARHLALSTDEPSAEIAELLEQAAQRARRHEAFDLAAEFAGHSLRLTPPSDGAALLRRACMEIDDLATAGEMRRALMLADRLVTSFPSGRTRVEAVLERAYLEDDHLDRCEELLVEALDQVEGDELLRARVLNQLGWSMGIFGRDLARARGYQREGVEVAARLGDTRLEMSFTAELAYLEGIAGCPRPELMARAVALEAESGRPIRWTSPRTLWAEQLLWAGDLAAARDVFQAVHEEAVRSGTAAHHPYSMFDLALVEIAAGDLGVAEAHVEEGIRAARDAEDTWGERLLLYPLALVQAWLGRGEEAREIAARRMREAVMKDERPGIVRAHGVLGVLALSEGDAASAARELAAAAALLDDMGFDHPGAFPVLPDAIEALACSGELDAAERLLQRLERQAAAVDSGWALAGAERCRGVLLLARGDADAAAAPLERAAAAFARLGHGPDGARAVFLRGRALLRAGRRGQAAEALADARSRFAGMGAALWEARVVEELERAAPGRAAGALTPAERRIAELVAEGRKNREIGQALYMSVGTVEAHLTRTYRKLGIRSRSELARLMADGGVG